MSRVKNDVVTPEQCRAARALLYINQKELADAAEIATKTIADFERGAVRELHIFTRRAIRAALEAKGVIFLDPNGEGPGVRLKKRK